MERVSIFMDYHFGPVWVYADDGVPFFRHPKIHDDPIIKKLSKQVVEKYNSYYEFDSHDIPCWFNEEKGKAEHQCLKELFDKIRERLDEINDGSFYVVNNEV